MRLKEIIKLNEYAIGVLDPISKETILHYLETAEQQRYHIVVKNGGPSSFIYRYDFGEHNFCYIFLNNKTKEYFGYCVTKPMTNNMVQISDIYLEPAVRNIGFARHIYAFISAVNNSYIINSPQLSLSSEKIWQGFKDKKIYNIKTKEFFDVSEIDGNNVINPKDDTTENQTWFYVYRETHNLLKAFENLNKHFNYDRFLTGEPGYIFERGSLDMTPMTRCYLTEEEREEEYIEYKKQRKLLYGR